MALPEFAGLHMFADGPRMAILRKVYIRIKSRVPWSHDSDQFMQVLNYLFCILTDVSISCSFDFFFESYWIIFRNCLIKYLQGLI